VAHGRSLDDLLRAACCSASGLLLALASSPPLAARNNLPPFFYFERQAVFGLLALAIMFLVSMMSPAAIRRWAVLGFVGAFLTLLALPVIGTDFGKGAVRWLSLGFVSVQPSEFMKPCLAVLAAWFLAAGQEINGPPGKMLSLGVTLAVGLPAGHAARFRPGGAGAVRLGGDVFRRRRADRPDPGAGGLAVAGRGRGL
jgi:cell division protein FtsW (lipid II flippase)